MFEEVKKRSKKMAAAFRNENSCLLRIGRFYYADTQRIAGSELSAGLVDVGA
jgi:hypothetical protein